MKTLVLFGIPFLGLFLVVLFLIGIFLTDTPRNTRNSNLTVANPLNSQKKTSIGPLRKTFGRVNIESKHYDPLSSSISDATLMNEEGTIYSLKTMEEAQNSTYSYLPETKTLIEHIDGENHPIHLEGNNILHLYRERGGNNIIIATDSNKTLVDEKGLPLRFKLLKKKV